MQYTITGTISRIEPPKTIEKGSNKFIVQTFILDYMIGSAIQRRKMQAVGVTTNFLATKPVGETVEVEFRLKGKLVKSKETQDEYFLNLDEVITIKKIR
jgi:hypothetical protein